MEKKKIDIEMADMVGKTYFKIATWFNKDFESDKERQEALKHTAAEIINTEAKTVVQGTPMKTINQTEGGTGKMIASADNAILNALRQENK